MNHRVGVLVLIALLLGLAAPAAAAPPPPGPRLAISVSSDGPGGEDESSEVITTGPLGEDPQPLFGGTGALIGESLSWSADGEVLAFSAPGVESTASGRFGGGWPVVGTVRADGSDVRVFPRAFLNAGDPVMAPDGASVAFQRLKIVKAFEGETYLFKSAIWLMDVEGGSVRRLTRWRLAASIEPLSYLPDGSAVVAELSDRKGSRIVAVDLRDHHSRRLASLGRNVSEPTYSPDGTKLAFVRRQGPRTMLPKPERPVSELMVARADGTHAKRVLRVKGYISFPSWDPSGSRLAFTRNPPAEATGELEPEFGNKVMAINADGTCLTRIFTDPAMTLFGTAWLPGVGREAGPLVC
jgi:Tol biopolymer transport system component